MGCATYHDDLERGQHYYEVSQYPNALAVWRTLEVDMDSLSFPEQSRYAYLRGMTDYRMGFRADARHWLAVSRAIEQKHPGGHDAKSAAELERVLAELNIAVYAMGSPPSAAATGIELTSLTPLGSASDTQLPSQAPAWLPMNQTPAATPAPAPQTPALQAPAPQPPAPRALAPQPPASVPIAPSTAPPVPPSPSTNLVPTVPPPSGF